MSTSTPSASAICTPVVHYEDEEDESWFGLVKQICWTIGHAVTLSYSNKYARKIQKWEVLDPAYKDPGYEAYSSEPLSARQMGMRTSIRAKQQREWDRLSVTLSMITATSAAALAIPSPFSSDNIYWASFACYSAAFGLSLEGLILITYLTVFASGSSAETIGRLARGKCFLRGLVGPVAFVVSLPTALTTYSSLYLLAGLLSMTIMKGRGGSIEEHEAMFNVIVLVPVCLVLVSIIVAVAGGELIAREEAKKRERRRFQMQRGDGTKVPSPYVDQEAQPVVSVAATTLPKQSGHGIIASPSDGEKESTEGANEEGHSLSAPVLRYGQDIPCTTV